MIIDDLLVNKMMRWQGNRVVHPVRVEIYLHYSVQEGGLSAELGEKSRNKKYADSRD